MKQRLDKHFLLNRAFVGTLLAIAVPIALQNMISFGVAVMDSVMLGSFGDVAIAAANLGGQPFSILMSFGFGLSSGGSVLIAQYWGKGDIGRIRKVMRISMQLVFLASLGITVVCLLMPEGILRIFTKDEAIVQAGAGYLALVAFSYIPYSLSNNYMMSLRAVEKVKISTAIYGVSFFVNVFFNYAFIFGKFGAPRLEVRGAAVGTIFARCSELVMVLIYMYFRENTVGFRMHDCLKFDREMLPSYTRHSLPVQRAAVGRGLCGHKRHHRAHRQCVRGGEQYCGRAQPAGVHQRVGRGQCGGRPYGQDHWRGQPRPRAESGQYTAAVQRAGGRVQLFAGTGHPAAVFVALQCHA